MKILFYGDSITDMGRKNNDLGEFCNDVFSFGNGYVFYAIGDLKRSDPTIEVINRGISGNRIVDLYARIKNAVWNHKPDVLSILIGVNDVWHEIARENGVEIERFDRIYRMLIEDTIKVLPEVKIVLMEPFVLEGSATTENYDRFLQVKEYAKVVKKIAEDYSLGFIPLQEKFDIAAEKYGVSTYLYDGVHPDIAGARLIADEWIKYYEKNLKK